jgi:hypothetical protein
MLKSEKGMSAPNDVACFYSPVIATVPRVIRVVFSIQPIGVCVGVNCAWNVMCGSALSVELEQRGSIGFVVYDHCGVRQFYCVAWYGDNLFN